MNRRKAGLFTAFFVAVTIAFTSAFPCGISAAENDNSKYSISADKKKDAYFKRICPLAEADMKESGILASMTIAQGILESGWGTSNMANTANNLFGIKAYSTWEGKVYSTNTKKIYKDYASAKNAGGKLFRAYDSWEDSVADHSRLLGTSKTYENIRNLTDYKLACKYLVDDGYVSDNNYEYADILVFLIEKYDLTKFDTLEAPVQAILEYPTSITLGARSITLGVGESYSFHTVLTPSNADTTLKWQSENGIATVTNGTVTGAKPGKSVISVETVNGMGIDCEVTVLPEFDYVISDSTLIECNVSEMTAFVPDNIIKIECDAFSECNAKIIIIPDSVIKINENAVPAENTVIYGGKGSAAEKYALDNDIDFILLSEYKPMLENGFINNLTEGINVGALKCVLENNDISVYDGRGNNISASAALIIGSGYTVEIDNKKYTAVVSGDINGDGKTDENDAKLFSKLLRNNIKMSALVEAAADTDKNGIINSTDYLRILHH